MVFMLYLSSFTDKMDMPTTMWLKINAWKIKFLKITLEGSLILPDFLISLLVFSAQASSPETSWGYVLDKPSPNSCIEPDFIPLSLHIPRVHARLQGWQANILETKWNHGTWHFNFASSASKIINHTAFCYQKIPQMSLHRLVHQWQHGWLSTPLPVPPSILSPCCWELRSSFNWLDYCRTMTPLLCSAEGLLPSGSVGILQEGNVTCSKRKPTSN